MNIFETIGVAYAILATTLFTVQLVYFCTRGVNTLQRLVARGQKEEILDLERSDSIRRELAN